ncbi:hypothetical protein HPB50_001994 [Hyalomma asiaticum]|uniref:Uncharacterized protein n=1 Tax=Hyalomma asiaticum TaxID=266040 RepID=A0ACB7RXJ3_HYAAI|nr:hypothetical protein HPB50_001994 [Hyalomma asiaticum]
MSGLPFSGESGEPAEPCTDGVVRHNYLSKPLATPAIPNAYTRQNSHSPSRRGYQMRSPAGRLQSSRSPQGRRPPSPLNSASASPQG